MKLMRKKKVLRLKNENQLTDLFGSLNECQETKVLKCDKEIDAKQL